MHIHLISIGGAVMHNMALALKNDGHHISGSDDEIFEPAKSRLAVQGILPEKFGWFSSNINTNIDLIILGMHARLDNPELLKAQELSIPIYSFPDFVYKQTAEKTRMVVAGSHGKTTTTAMLMHVYKTLEKKFDYLVGSLIEGYDSMVKFSDAPISIIEGDEYLSSALDRRPKFFHYRPQLSMITGIAWDHINVFPTFENYLLQFQLYLESIPKGGVCVYNEEDKDLNTLVLQHKDNLSIKVIPYKTLSYKTLEHGLSIDYKGKTYVMPWFGKHNVSNMSGAMLLAKENCILEEDFLAAMQTFDGTARRLEKIYEKDGLTVIRDFAHSPSKLKATVEAVKEQYHHQKVYAFFELHTYSSLQLDFLPHYENCMQKADKAFVYIDNHVFEIKKMEPLTSMQIEAGFVSPITVLDNKLALIEHLKSIDKQDTVILLMSSGSFSGLTIADYIG